MASERLMLPPSTLPPRVQDGAVGDAGPPRLAYGLLLAGALAVLVTCAAYALAGPLAALPGGGVPLDAARAATPAAAGWMRLAGLFGLPGDVLLSVAGLMLAVAERARPRAMAGWLALAFIGAVFFAVDGMVGFVLPGLATLPGGEAAYAGVRALFDMLFLAGTLVGGAGGLAIAWGTAAGPRGWTGLMRAAGGLSLATGAAGLLGWPLPQAVGLSVTLMVLALAGWGASRCRRTQPAPALSRPGIPPG